MLPDHAAMPERNQHLGSVDLVDGIADFEHFAQGGDGALGQWRGGAQGGGEQEQQATGIHHESVGIWF